MPLGSLPAGRGCEPSSAPRRRRRQRQSRAPSRVHGAHRGRRGRRGRRGPAGWPSRMMALGSLVLSARRRPNQALSVVDSDGYDSPCTQPLGNSAPATLRHSLTLPARNASQKSFPARLSPASPPARHQTGRGVDLPMLPMLPMLPTHAYASTCLDLACLARSGLLLRLPLPSRPCPAYHDSRVHGRRPGY
jgi:hypothetical protein